MQASDRRLALGFVGTLILGAAVILFGCEAQLPEPASPGAVIYAARCSSCHRLYAPASMKKAMWDIVLERMQGLMASDRAGPLSQKELEILRSYLRRHAG